MNQKPTVIGLLDAKYLCYFYGSNKEGLDVNKKRIFENIFKLINSLMFKGVFPVLIWDNPSKWRHSYYPLYKTSRQKNVALSVFKKMLEEELLPWLRTSLECLDCLQIEHLDSEADDLAFHLSYKTFKKQPILLVTGDSDWAQLISERVQLRDLRAKKIIGAKDFETKDFPFKDGEEFWQVKAIEGDKSDDIFGIPDIGPSRALYVLRKYGGFEGLIESLRNGSFKESKVFKGFEASDTIEILKRNESLTRLEVAPVMPKEGLVVKLTTKVSFEAFSDFIAENCLDPALRYPRDFDVFSKSDIVRHKIVNSFY